MKFIRTTGYQFFQTHAMVLGVSLITIGYLFAFAQWRLTVNVEYDGAKWQDLVALTAPRPFGLRMLVPFLARPWIQLLDGAIWPVFFGFEFLFAGGLWLTLYTLFRKYLSTLLSYAGASLFFFVLMIPFTLPHRWSVFYPADTASMFFIGLALLLATGRQWGWLVLVTAIAALNRETAALIPLLAASFWITTKYARQALVWSGIALLAYLVVRWGLDVWLYYLPGDALHFTLGSKWRLQNNLEWLAAPRNWLIFLSYFSFLPLWWTVLFRYIPVPMRNMRYVAALYFSGLMVVGNMYEPRIFGEILVIMYIPLIFGWHALAIQNTQRYRTRWPIRMRGLQNLLDLPGVCFLLTGALIAAGIFLRLNPLPHL